MKSSMRLKYRYRLTGPRALGETPGTESNMTKSQAAGGPGKAYKDLSAI